MQPYAKVDIGYFLKNYLILSHEDICHIIGAVSDEQIN